MSIPDRIKQMEEINATSLEIFKRKNQDYGDSFAIYGIIGVMIRMQDKIQRFLSISKSGINLVNDESLEDTLLDLHNYSAMAMMLLQENKEKKDKST